MLLTKSDIEEVFKKDILIGSSSDYRFVFNIFDNEYKILHNAAEISGGQAVEELIEEYDDLTNEKSPLDMNHIDQILITPIILGSESTHRGSKQIVFIIKTNSFIIYKDKELNSESLDLDAAVEIYNSL